MKRMFVQVARITAVVMAALLGSAGFGVPLAHAAPTGPSPRSVLVILVDWAGTNTTPAAPPDYVTPAVAAGQVGGTDTGWYGAVSYGQFGGWNAAATGWYQIATPPLDSGASCGNAFRATIQAEGNQAAAAAGYDPSSYPVVMYYFSSFPCGWGGWTIGYNAVWINGAMDTAATAHELGHTLGLGHGHALSCTGANGQPVALSSNCAPIEYGDGYDVMGCCGAGSFTGIQKFDLGWMSGREKDVPASGGTFTLEPLEATTPGLQALRLTDGNQTFWLDYRQPIGVDNWLSPSSTNGILIYEQLPDGYTPLGSYLLDMTPGSPGGFDDAPLPAGTSWTDPLGHDVITVNSAGAAGAQVTITPRTAMVPSVVGDLAATAASEIRAAGFSVNEQTFVDGTCENINRVASQSPRGGSAAILGTTVTIRVGTRPPHPCP
jgi:hypothetical protein